MHLYADDTQLYLSFFPNDVANAQTKINDDLRKLLAFSESHNLSINTTKSSVMIFGKQKDNIKHTFKIRINGEDIHSSNTGRNLGLHFDDALRFKPHVNKCIQTAYANLKMLFPNRHLLSKSLKIKLMDSLVLSHFNFCDVVYGPCLDKLDNNRIERVQKSCLRFIHGIRKHEPISYKLKDTNWLSMENRRKLHSVSLFHSIIVSEQPPYLADKIKFRTDVHNLNLRHRGYISPPPHQTAYFQRSFTYNIYKLYNQVPEILKTHNSVSFKKLFKKHLLNYM